MSMFPGGHPTHVLGPVPGLPGRNITFPVNNDTDRNTPSNVSSQYDSDRDTDNDEIHTRIITKKGEVHQGEEGGSSKRVSDGSLDRVRHRPRVG